MYRIFVFATLDPPPCSRHPVPATLRPPLCYQIRFIDSPVSAPVNASAPTAFSTNTSAYFVVDLRTSPTNRTGQPLLIPTKKEMRNRIFVSWGKRPTHFFTGLGKKLLISEEEVELTGLGFAIATVITVAELLKTSRHATISSTYPRASMFRSTPHSPTLYFDSSSAY
eukprot:IDg4563t1